MTFQEVLYITGDSPIFSTSVLLAGQPSADGIRRQLDRWVNSGKIIRLRRGVYSVAEPYATAHPHPFIVANALRIASYVSLQSALAYYGMIPEYTPVTTSITTDRPETVVNPAGKFVFRHIKKTMFFGYYEQEIVPRQKALIATPAKALVDLLYLTPNSDQIDYLEELRLSPASKLDPEQLDEAVEKSKSPKVKRAVTIIKEIWKNEDEYVRL